MDPRLRDVLLMAGGLAGMAHQTLLAPSPSPTLVGAFLAMMLGAPVVYRLVDRFTGPPRDKDPRP